MINKKLAEKNLETNLDVDDDGLGMFDLDEAVTLGDTEEDQRIEAVNDLGEADSLHLGGFNPIANFRASVISHGL